MSTPHRQRWISQPLAVDVGFQLMVLWAMAERGVGSLPTMFAEYRQYAAQFPPGPIEVVARVVERQEHRAVADIEWVARSEDGGATLLARMRGFECVIDGSLNAAFRRNRVVKGVRART
jgi:hypothetical protein